MVKYKLQHYGLGLCLLGVVLLMAGCSTTSLSSGQERNLDMASFSVDEGIYPDSTSLFTDYRLAPGDLLDVLFQISTWEVKERFVIGVDDVIQVKFIDIPDLNVEQNVKPDGRISLPYLDQIEAAGRTVAELTDELKQKYKRYLRNPEVFVVVPEYSAHIKELKHDLHTAPRGLSRLVTIRPDGYVTFPLIGDVFVANRTIPEVDAQIDEMYDAFLPGLTVNLFLEKSSGAVVYVLGEVNKPGAFSVARPISVMQAVALAEGMSSYAKPSSVIVFRFPTPKPIEENYDKYAKTGGRKIEKTRGVSKVLDDSMDGTRPANTFAPASTDEPQEEVQDKPKIIARRFDLESAMNGDKGASLFFLRPNDIVYVPKTELHQVAEVMNDVKDIMMFRGWGITLGADLIDDPLLDFDDSRWSGRTKSEVRSDYIINSNN
ncbi:polysaccharide biosynthesis/export family protein [Desulfovibrio inopinatus]|uniref:polysaccharide biosynthesis/export family protein n=1 Tax=Desulfovibrio inopinatus TaxID=102109 RepID=UPI0003FD6119|nr:polysaccharide biosynthesis/export family protein [Desulfovibrio inopinatus]